MKIIIINTQKWIYKLWFLLTHNSIYFLLVIVAILPQFWFKQGYLYGSGDISPPIYAVNFEKYFYTWDTTNGLGYCGSPIVNVPFVALFYLMYSIGIPFWLTQRTFYTLILVIITYSMYYFIESNVKNKSAATVASFFYVFNIQGFLNALNPVYQTAYALSPMMLGLIGKGAEHNSQKNKYLILIGLLSLPLSFVFTSPPLLAISLLTFILYSGFQVLVSKDKLWAIVFNIESFLIMFLINLWWILPAYTSIFLSSSIVSVKGPLSVSAWTMSRATMINVLRLNWDWYWINQGYLSFNIGFYNSSFMYFASIIPSIVVFGALLIKPRSERIRHNLIFFSIVALVSIFLQKGINEPFPSIYNTLFEIVPFFWIFRTPKFAITLLISFSFLIGVFFSYILSNSSKSQKRRILVISYTLGFLLINSLLSFPMFVDQVIPPTYTSGNQALIKIPDYWFDIENWIQNRSKDPRILILPPDPFYAVGYVWNYYGTDNIPRFILKGSVITPIPAPSFYGGGYITNIGRINITSTLYQSVTCLNPITFMNLIESTGIQYIVLRGDIDYNVLSSQGLNTSLSKMQRFLSNITDIKLCATFDKLFIYEVIKSTSIFYSIPYSVITNINKVNPTTYYLQINASVPFLLIFKDSYDPGWRIYSGENSWLSLFIQKPILNSSRIHGYANCWQIYRTGKYTITVYYEPQNYGNLGEIISLVVLIGLISLGAPYWLGIKTNFLMLRSDKNS